MTLAKPLKFLLIGASLAAACYVGILALKGEPSAEERLSELLAKAEAGDSTAQYEVARAYLHGEGTTHDTEKVIKWYQRAAEGGNVKAQIELSNHYYSIDQWKLGASWLAKAAKQGDAHAQVSYGVILQKAQGVERDLVKAASWFEKSAAQNNRLGQYLTARCYHLGEGVGRDDVKAAAWMRRAAENGHFEAKYGLGVLYDLGEGVKANAAEAAKWYSISAENGISQAQRNLGICYLEGFGVTRDPIKGAALLEKVAKYNGSAAYELYLVRSMTEYHLYDPDKAIEWLKLAAQLENPDASFKYGEMLWYGRGVPKDETAGAALINKAAFERQPNAMLLKGLLAKNTKMENGAMLSMPSQTWIYGAAEKGLHEAQFLTGLYLIEAKDTMKGADFLRKAALQGNAKAQRELGRILYFGVGVPKDEIEGYAFLNLAAGADADAASIRNFIEKTLPAEARLAAQKRSREFNAEIEAAVRLAEKPFRLVRSAELPECSKY